MKRLGAALLVMGLVCGIGYAAWRTRGDVAPTGMRAQLGGRGRVIVPDGSPFLTSLPGTEAIVAPASVRAALADDDPVALANTLQEAGASALLVSTLPADVDAHEASSVVARLSRYQHVPPLRAEYLTPTAVLYTHDALTSDALAHGRLLARIARGILEGRRPPPSGMLPESLRQSSPVEVMVLLRSNGDARLWRSSRGSSVARALNTAASAARQRWGERSQALGGPLAELLPQMDVEVSLLVEDGDLAERTDPFIERVFTPAHGVAYERQRVWRYLRPEATREHGHGSAVRAYEWLLADDGREPAALREAQLRLYRVVQRPLGRSPGQPRRLELPAP